MKRRDFLKTAAAGTLLLMAPWQEAYARGRRHAEVGWPLPAWKKGELQVHFIYTGVAESMFFIFPDGTTLLLDCGDHNAIGRGKLAVPVLPNGDRHAGEWIARYVERVNPQGRDVDYMMLSHYHSDHGGCETFYAEKTQRDDMDYYLSGFSQAAETLRFRKAFDRCYPDYTDPIPLVDDGAKMRTHMQKFYDYERRMHGLEVEKFRVGERDQIRMTRQPERYKDFSIFNLCGNGRIADPATGTVTDLYTERKQHPPRSFNENGMSLGMLVEYGNFRLYTAGDFSDGWNLTDGSRFEIEDALAKVCPPCQVAKINHHGHYSMPEKLISALRSRVYMSCVWDQLHNVAPVMARLYDRRLYDGDRLVCPGIFPKERREEDAGREWLDILPKESFDGGHVVLTVPRGGRHYRVSYVTAEDESMTVKSIMEFDS